MKVIETSMQRPASVPRSLRMDRWRGLTSCKAGVVVPIAYFPLLREDAISGTINVSVRMQETVLPLLNGVRCKVMAHLFPNTADARFSSLEQLNASYRNEANFGGQPTPPFVDTVAFPASSAIYDALGVHQGGVVQVNRLIVYAYNAIVNARRQSRTNKLPARGGNDNTLAQAFWHDPNRWNIVPDFDSALIEGIVPLSGQAPVTGIGIQDGTAQTPFVGVLRETDKLAPTTGLTLMSAATASSVGVAGGGTTAANFWPEIFADLGINSDYGVGMSLANLAMVQKTQAFARLREQYVGVNEDFVIDLLMSGISVPPSQLFEPILLGSGVGQFGMMERHATDFANLDKSYTTGMVNISVPVRTPPINPGGLVLVTLEIVPESLPELGADPFLEIDNPAKYPDFVDDTLDPEKVEYVPNRHIDAYHNSPDAIFGYQPLNARWNRDFARLGGKYLDGNVPSTSEERYRFWQVRPTNPTLAEDFYLCPSPFPHDVFADSAADPFEVTTLATMRISGLTVFGPALNENVDAYEDTQRGVDTGRLQQSAQGLVEAEPEAPVQSPASNKKGDDDAAV